MSTPVGATWPGDNPVYGLDEGLAPAAPNPGITAAVDRTAWPATSTLDSTAVELENPLYDSRREGGGADVHDYATLDPSVCYSADANSRDLPPLQVTMGVYESTPE